MRSYSPINDDIIQSLVNAVGSDCIIQDLEKRGPFGRDAGEDVRMPDLVVEPTRSEQIQEVMRLADRFHFPVTPRGARHGSCGRGGSAFRRGVAVACRYESNPCG